MSRTALAALALAAIAVGQTTSTHLLWALDAGNQSSPAPTIRTYGPAGDVRLTVVVPGSGPARALAADPDGTMWVCRGDQVHQLSPTGAATGVVLAPPTGSARAMDVLPTVGGDVWVAWGNTAAESALTRYSATGTQVSNHTDPDLEHPRRLASALVSAPNEIYVANRTASEILRYDVAADTFTLVSALSMGTFGPVGLAFNEVDGSLWLSGDWGQPSQTLGRIGNPQGTGSFTTAFPYGMNQAPGLAAPAGMEHDRFDRLYVAGRNANGGTAGIYVFEAGPATTLTYLRSFPVGGLPAPTNVIDVAAQTTLIDTLTPTNATDVPILRLGQMNLVTFRGPLFAGQLYGAGLSLEWPTCPTLTITDPFIRFAPTDPDPRGIPLCLDELLMVTAGLGISSPGPTNLFVGVAGFGGTLDATTGEAAGAIDLTQLGSPALAGISLSIAWVSFTPAGQLEAIAPSKSLLLTL